MSDAEQNLNQVEEAQQTDYKALYEETVKKLETVASHKDKLYQETKKAKAEREAAESEARRVAEEKAQKDGEYEKLWQTAKQEKEQLLNEMQQFKQSLRQDKLNNVAMQIATSLADGDDAAILKEFIVKSIDKMSDETGALSADVIEAVSNEYKNNKMFSKLLRSSKATGGGAVGNTRGVGKTTTLSRSDFDKLSPAKQMEFATKVRSGQATLTDF